MEHPQSTTMFLNAVIKLSLLWKEPFDVNKLLCYESYLDKMGFDTMNC